MLFVVLGELSSAFGDCLRLSISVFGCAICEFFSLSGGWLDVGVGFVFGCLFWVALAFGCVIFWWVVLWVVVWRGCGRGGGGYLFYSGVCSCWWGCFLRWCAPVCVCVVKGCFCLCVVMVSGSVWFFGVWVVVCISLCFG